MTNPETAEIKLHSITLVSVMLLAFLGFLAVGPIIGIFLISPFYDFDIVRISAALSNPESEQGFRIPLLVVQGMSSFIGFVAVPFFYFKYLKLDLLAYSNLKLGNPVKNIALIAMITLVFMGVNSIFIEWNADLNFPGFLEGFENWARAIENQAEILTEYLVSFESFGEFFAAVIVIAAIPAIGEEVVFRGILQKQLFYSSRNIHLAIWMAAILFSAFHLQFFGFVPRVLLGALFGYLYFWSGSLLVPILAHFVNNGFTLLMVYLFQIEAIDYDIQNTSQNTSLFAFFLSVFIFLALIVYFKRLNVKEEETNA